LLHHRRPHGSKTKLAARHLASDDGLHEEAEVGEHGQAPVLDLLHLQSGSVAQLNATMRLRVLPTQLR